MHVIVHELNDIGIIPVLLSFFIVIRFEHMLVATEQKTIIIAPSNNIVKMGTPTTER